MSELLVFFGAGASKALANIPTMKDMVPLFEQELKQEPQMVELYSGIVDALREPYADRLDLEAVFSVLNGIASGRTFEDIGFHATYEAKRLGVPASKPPSSDIQAVAGKLMMKFENFVARKCEMAPEAKTGLIKLYSQFTDILPASDKAKGQVIPFHEEDPIWYSRSHWAFYTTNYDLCIENVCSDARIEIERGSDYDRGLDRRIVRPERLGLDTFKIVKLHGSLSWYRRKDGMQLEYPEGVPTRESIEGRVMLYPIEEKAMYEEPYIILINHFRQDLKKARRWLFIGYRFNDPFLLRIIQYCSHKEKRVGLVHPRAADLIETRLKQVDAAKTAFVRTFGDDILLGELQNWLTSS